jgi:hypothetical protein
LKQQLEFLDLLLKIAQNLVFCPSRVKLLDKVDKITAFACAEIMPQFCLVLTTNEGVLSERKGEQ